MGDAALLCHSPLCAAISAHEHGAWVAMLEAAPFEERGGNSHFTGGAFRFAFDGVDEVIAALPSLAEEDLVNIDFGTYTQAQFFDDLLELAQYRAATLPLPRETAGPSVMGPVMSSLPSDVTPPSSRFCPWSAPRPPHYAVRRNGEPI